MISRIVLAGSCIIAAVFFLWNAIVYDNSEFYKHVSPLHVISMIFYFNIFLINLKLENRKLSKNMNILLILLSSGIIIAGDVYTYEHNKEEFMHIVYILIDIAYSFFLIVLAVENHESRLSKDTHSIIILMALQFGYSLTIFSQVIPLYMQKKIPLSNDFAYVFWMLYILQSIVKKKEVMEKKNIIVIICYFTSTLVAVYLFSVVNERSGEIEPGVLSTVRKFSLFFSNLFLYLWSIFTFIPVDENYVDGSGSTDSLVG